MEKSRFILDSLKTAAFCFMCIAVGLTALEVRDRSSALLTDIRRVTLSMGGVSANVRAATEEWKKASGESIETSRKVNEVLDQVTHLVQDTNTRLNGDAGVLQQTTVVLTNLDDRTERVTASLQDTGLRLASLSDHLNPMLDEGTRTFETVRLRFDDPSLDELADNLVATSGHLDTTAINLSDAAANLRDTLAPQHQRFWGILLKWSLRIGDAVDWWKVWAD